MREKGAMNMAQRELLTVEEVQAVLGIGRWKAYRMIERGELPTLRVGRLVRVPRAALMGWIAANTRPAERGVA